MWLAIGSFELTCPYCFIPVGCPPTLHTQERQMSLPLWPVSYIYCYLVRQLLSAQSEMSQSSFYHKIIKTPDRQSCNGWTKVEYRQVFSLWWDSPLCLSVFKLWDFSSLLPSQMTFSFHCWLLSTDTSESELEPISWSWDPYKVCIYSILITPECPINLKVHVFEMWEDIEENLHRHNYTNSTQKSPW